MCRPSVAEEDKAGSARARQRAESRSRHEWVFLHRRERSRCRKESKCSRKRVAVAGYPEALPFSGVEARAHGT